MERSTYKDYYKILEVDYDATDEIIRLNYRKLVLPWTKNPHNSLLFWHVPKWHPDKHGGDTTNTEIFQEINEAYTVLSDPDKRLEYDVNGNYEIDRFSLRI